jgi:hypothetical protein
VTSHLKKRLGRLEGRIRSMLGDHTEDDLDEVIQREATRL